MANRVVLKQISSETDDVTRAFNLKSDKKEWAGLMFYGPSVGKSFSFFRDDEEYMHTSTIKDIQYVSGNELKFTTRNSEYLLTIGEAQEPL